MRAIIPDINLLEKYNCEIPRYTSYPTAPYWYDFEDRHQYFEKFISGFEENNRTEGISLYIHLPFCEELCTYCGCNKIITNNHMVEEKYWQAVLCEWYHYRELMTESPVIREMHLGGGTPTFFSPENLRRLLNCILEIADIHPKREFSIEGHPNNTTLAHLRLLHQFGFERISFGVQDHDPEVQRMINRIQPYENVKRATEQARETGFTSVNYDLIYGLPGQSEKSIEKTIHDTILLKPDRIAFYSYAHIPWKAKGQRLYNENDLPAPEKKLKFYLTGRQMLLEAGYVDIGMDHFALPQDKLHQAFKKGKFHRNFMGYTTTQTNYLIGLGVSAISDLGTAYAQNSKELLNYYRKLDVGKIPVKRGSILDETDKAMRRYILDIACKGKTDFNDKHKTIIDRYILHELKTLAEDGLIFLDHKGLQVTEIGRVFLRNICHAFDLKQRMSKDDKIRFSKSV
jgi:oxygen-independent coproporphyrinogen-3 oxidase